MWKIIKNLISPKKTVGSASQAKARLQIVVNKEEFQNPLLTAIEEDLVDAIMKYAKVNPNNVDCGLDDMEADLLTLNAEREADIVQGNSFLRTILNKRSDSANKAKERLQIIVSKGDSCVDFAGDLKKDVYDIINSHVSSQPNFVDVFVDPDYVEINVNLPEELNK
jgi:septum formation topological specificity factor MinE